MSEVLTDADVLELRGVVEEILPDRADIFHRSGEGSSEWGGSSASYPAVPDERSVPVLFGARSAQELARAQLQSTTIDQILTFPGGTNVRQTDKVVIEAESFEVLQVAGGGSWEITIPVVVRRVQ